MVFQTSILNAFGERKQVDANELEFSKAFNRVSSKIRERKLEECGFTGGLLRWFSNYLRGRQQTESSLQKGGFSRDFHATSSVPQGSILGPPLFNAYSSMICVTVDLLYRSVQFADDLKLYFKICSEDDLDLLQECL